MKHNILTIMGSAWLIAACNGTVNLGGEGGSDPGETGGGVGTSSGAGGANEGGANAGWGGSEPGTTTTSSGWGGSDPGEGGGHAGGSYPGGGSNWGGSDPGEGGSGWGGSDPGGGGYGWGGSDPGGGGGEPNYACEDEYGACIDTPSCVELLECIDECGSDSDCVDLCVELYPEGVVAYITWVSCESHW